MIGEGALVDVHKKRGGLEGIDCEALNSHLGSGKGERERGGNEQDK